MFQTLLYTKVTMLFQIIRQVLTISNPCGQLYLTQSPTKQKNIQLNWNFTCDNPPDTILLTSHHPTNPDHQILHTIYPGSVQKGHHQTPHTLKNTQFPGNWSEGDGNPDLQSHCFDFHITATKNNTVIHSQCLSIEPTWMAKFGDLRIGGMMIPGTHNSGAWRGGPPLIKNFVLNQDKNFWEQLVYGVRFFDIRVGRYRNGFFINHSYFKCTELVPELLRVANFVKKSPKEVVVLNFHNFPRPRNFTKDYHLELLETVETLFGSLVFPFYKVRHRQGPKLRDFWEARQPVIISYGNYDLVREYSWLWPSVRRHWGNIQKLELLEVYINSIANTTVLGNPMHVLMAELTPDYISIIKHVTRDLKDMSIMVNRELSDWVRKNNRSNNLNIIATDYFTGNDMINVAIEMNFQKLN